MLLAGKIGSSNYKALLFALLTAVCISGYTIASGFGVRTAESFIVYAAWLEFISGSLFVATALYKYRGTAKLSGITWENSHLDVVAGLLAIVGFGVALWAMTKIPFAAVSALRETSVVFAVLIGYLLFKEQQGLKRLFATGIVLAGIWMMLSINSIE